MTQRNRRNVTQSDNHDLPTVAARGDRRRSLELIRDKLARELADATGKDCAPLALRLSAIMAEIDAISAPERESPVERIRDDLAAKRAARQATAG